MAPIKRYCFPVTGRINFGKKEAIRPWHCVKSYFLGLEIRILEFLEPVRESHKFSMIFVNRACMLLLIEYSV